MGTDKGNAGHSSGFAYKQVETDVITKTPDDHRCDQIHRLDKIERRLDKHDALLSDGKSEFTAVRADIKYLTIAVEAMKNQLERVIASQAEAQKPVPIGTKIQDAIIFWAVPIVGGALLWAIMASGQIPKGVHP